MTDQHNEPNIPATPETPPETSALPREKLDRTEEMNVPRDQIDRSIVMADGLKTLSMWALRLLIIAVFLYAAWQLLKQVGQGVLPITFAIIICTVLAPPTTWMRRKGVPSALAAIISILFFFGAFGTLISMIAPDIARQSQILYLQTLEGVQRVQLWAQGPPLNLDGEDLNQLVNEAATWLQGQAGTIAGGIASGLGTATSMVITLFVVLVLTFFFLKDGPRFLQTVRNIVGRRMGWHATEGLTRGWNTLGGFIRAQAIVSFIDAFFITLGLLIVGVPMALALGVITFIAGFIPFVGAIVAGALAVLIALVSLGFTEAVIVLAIVLAVQQLEGNILSPWLQSKAMNLHPVIVLVSVTVGGGLFGLLGAFLAVPAVAMIAVTFRYMLEIISLRSGEKLASEIEFSTPEGRLVGRAEEKEGRAMRQRWHDSMSYSDEDQSSSSQSSDSPAHGKESPAPTGKNVPPHLGGIEKLFARIGRR